MIAVLDVSHKTGEYQRPYLTVFKISHTPNQSYLAIKGTNYNRISVLNTLICIAENSLQQSQSVIDHHAPYFEAHDMQIAMGKQPLEKSYLEARRLTSEAVANIMVQRQNLFDMRSELAGLQADDFNLLNKRYPVFVKIKDNIDLFSLKTVLPDRKSQMKEFW